MIHIIRESKNSHRTKRLKLSLSDAKRYLYDLQKRNFNIHRYIILGADTEIEQQRFIEMFNPKALKSEVRDGFDIYILDEELPKNERFIQTGATVRSIENFAKKLQGKLEGSIVSVEYYPEGFILMIAFVNISVHIVCSYKLEILKKYIVNSESSPMDTEISEEIVNLVNRLFNKQRYYYRKKDGNN